MHTIKKDIVPDYLLNMQLSEMRCKHVLHMGDKERAVLSLSNEIGYEWCEWGKHCGHAGDFNYHMEIIRKIEQDNYHHAIRIVICKYEFLDENVIWVDNLHSAIFYIRKYGKNVTLKQVPFYIVDLTSDTDVIIGYKGSLRNCKDDVLGAIACAHKRRNRSNSEKLISVNYRISDFILSNQRLLSN